jgi:cytoplasmic iron level regulating protein YaaA (DUF328/UPF0246 family)
LIVLIHTSKTMRAPDPRPTPKPGRAPALLDRAGELIEYLRTLSPQRLGTAMGLSGPLAAKTHELHEGWTTDPHRQRPAVDSFLGDIYSGLRASEFTPAQRSYADRHLRIVSGLYGILRPYDGICPYRLEMGARLPDARYRNLYPFWGRSIAEQLPASGPVINLAAKEYSRAVLSGLDPARVVTPTFLTGDRFVAVHAKVARGAFARWLLTTRADDLTLFTDLGYSYRPERSGDREPCFVCTEFGGKGLSVRLS